MKSLKLIKGFNESNHKYCKFTCLHYANMMITSLRYRIIDKGLCGKQYETVRDSP